MKVLLVKPGNLSDHIQPSLGLGYIAAQIRSNRDVLIIDCIKDKLTGEQLRPVLEDFQPDLVGSQCYSMDLPNVKLIFQAVKSFNKNTITIVGGAHPTALPNETMDFMGTDLLDFVFAGEAELGFPKFLTLLELNEQNNFSKVPGLCWKKNGQLQINQKESVEDLGSIGMPAWDLLKPESYPFSPHGVVCMNYPIAPVMATRGCPYKCTFCTTSGSKLRKRPIESIIEEVKLLYYQHGIREFHMVDDNFTMDMDYAKKLLQNIIELNIDATWATPNGIRLDRVDKRILELMKDAGFYSISFGVESGSERIRKKMKKGSTTEKVRKDLELVKQVGGIDMTGFFMLGFPGETREDIEKTLRFSRELPLQRATFHAFIPLPGTEVWQEMENNGELARVDWEHYFFWAGAYVPQGLTHKELKNLHRKAFFLFYLRPRIIFQNLKYILKPRVLWYAIRYLFRRIKL